MARLNWLLADAAAATLSYAERDEAYCIYVQHTEEEVFRVRIKASDTIGSLKTRLWKGGLTISGEKNLTKKKLICH